MEARDAEPTEPAEPGYVWVWNLMTQAWIQQPADTPYFCRVDSETFWSS